MSNKLQDLVAVIQKKEVRKRSLESRFVQQFHYIVKILDFSMLQCSTQGFSK